MIKLKSKFEIEENKYNWTILRIQIFYSNLNQMNTMDLRRLVNSFNKNTLNLKKFIPINGNSRLRLCRDRASDDTKQSSHIPM